MQLFYHTVQSNANTDVGYVTVGSKINNKLLTSSFRRKDSISVIKMNVSKTIKSKYYVTGKAFNLNFLK